MNLDTIHINKWILTDNLLSRGGRDTGVTVEHVGKVETTDGQGIHFH